jgi:hypothetical protein
MKVQFTQETSQAMYEALKGLLEISDRYTGVGRSEITAARAALALADGETIVPGSWAERPVK